ncbi:LCP family protein [Dactylosporangium sp. AC04546]|uniref:LCP family protein n=1 Tax=Dactylosporangium sp. AC04546 TaxID=2862460 RepID=UPI001EE07356|nr:LCP family protein [Dactylosporangium sp. AC04546]WVK84357.1 LCP family protein [Dactylosporangium sp. AC04546]
MEALAKGGVARRKGRGRRDPLWARILVVVGSLLMISAGTTFVLKDVVFGYATRSVHKEDLLPAEQGKRASVSGAKNILLIGIDPRPNQNPTDSIRSDSILILHIPASHDMAFLISIPRDTWVSIPKYSNGKQTFNGGKDKINGAFAAGGNGLTGKDQRKHGTTLLAQTIKQNWGVTFDAAAIIDFVGFQEVVKVLGGVDMYVDQRTVSVHNGTDAQGNHKVPFEQRDNGSGGTTLIPIKGVTPKVYEVGFQHLAAWEALDFVRQRETLPNSDYDRQRHQQQFIKALLKKIASKEVLGNPSKLNSVLSVVGSAMTIDTGPIGLDDWIFAMRGIDGDRLLTLKTNNGGFHASTEHPGAEALDQTTLELLAAVRDKNVPAFVTANPSIVSSS